MNRERFIYFFGSKWVRVGDLEGRLTSMPLVRILIHESSLVWELNFTVVAFYCDECVWETRNNHASEYHSSRIAVFD